MAPVMNGSKKAHGGTGKHKAEIPSYLITTLYDVIAAIQDELSPDDDALVVATVVHLLRSGRLTWRGKPRVRPDLSPHVAPRTTAATSSSVGQREALIP